MYLNILAMIIESGCGLRIPRTLVMLGIRCWRMTRCSSCVVFPFLENGTSILRKNLSFRKGSIIWVFCLHGNIEGQHKSLRLHSTYLLHWYQEWFLIFPNFSFQEELGEVLSSIGSKETLNLQSESCSITRRNLQDENANLSSSSPALLQPLRQHQQQSQKGKKPQLRLNVSHLNYQCKEWPSNPIIICHYLERFPCTKDTRSNIYVLGQICG